jgi:hypothetical protein
MRPPSDRCVRLMPSGVPRRRLTLLVPGVIVTGLVVAGAGLSLSSDISGSAAPSVSVALRGPERPYTASSAWNTPIGANPEIDVSSRAFVDGIARAAEGGVITSDPTQYSYPVYEAGADTPRYDLPCTWYKCMITRPGADPILVETLEDVPIPVGAQPSAGSDGSMIVIDVASGTEYDLWMARREGDSWAVGNATVYNIAWDGMPTAYGSRGAGLPYLAGLVRYWEVAAGKIDHAIAFAYPEVAAAGCVWPASKTDGSSPATDALLEGARLQLDPSLTDDDFATMGVDAVGRVIARALQTYGMILIDVSQRPKIMVEDLNSNPYASGSWMKRPTQLSESTISAIPIGAFRVLALPQAYRSPTPDSATHGDCYQ